MPERCCSVKIDGDVEPGDELDSDNDNDPIVQLFSSVQEIISGLSKEELGVRTSAASMLVKHAVMCSGSYFESRLCETVSDFLRESSRDLKVAEFGIGQGVKRKYHTWFEWKVDKPRGANVFFALFGRSYKDHAVEIVKRDESLQVAIRSFLRLGRLRNELAHSDLVVASTEVTLDEVRVLYAQAKGFVAFIASDLPSVTDRTQTAT